MRKSNSSRPELSASSGRKQKALIHVFQAVRRRKCGIRGVKPVSALESNVAGGGWGHVLLTKSREGLGQECRQRGEVMLSTERDGERLERRGPAPAGGRSPCRVGQRLGRTRYYIGKSTTEANYRTTLSSRTERVACEHIACNGTADSVPSAAIPFPCEVTEYRLESRRKATKKTAQHIISVETKKA
jgi:hypothetical protein